MYNEDLNSEKLRINIDSIDKKIKKKIVLNDWKIIELIGGEAKFVVSPVVDFTINDVNSCFMVQGKVSGVLETQCSRCLKLTKISFENSIDSTFLSEDNIDFDEKEKLDSLENEYYYKDGVLDLTERIIEAIILSVPEKILCKNDCKGLCPVCGFNLNDDPSHVCEDNDVDPRFAKLLDLLDDKK